MLLRGCPSDQRRKLKNKQNSCLITESFALQFQYPLRQAITAGKTIVSTEPRARLETQKAAETEPSPGQTSTGGLIHRRTSDGILWLCASDKPIIINVKVASATHESPSPSRGRRRGFAEHCSAPP